MSTNTPVIDQPPLEAHLESKDSVPLAHASKPTAPRVALDWLHRDVAGAFVAGGSPALAELATDAARALAQGTDRERNEARVRLSARMIAVGRMHIQSLELALSEAVVRRDDKGAALISKTLDGISRRLEVWLREHRLSCSTAPRSVSVAINSAEHVEITGEK